MFHTHPRALGTGLATALTLAVTAAPAAVAQPINPRSPDARHAAASTPRMTDLRSPDTRDPADGRQTVATGPPTWAVNPQPITKPRTIASTPSSGLDLGSAGIGAAAVLGAFAIAAAGILGVRRRRVARPGSLSAR
jgi:hypothetical protein